MPMLNRTDLINDHDAGVRSLNDRGGQELKENGSAGLQPNQMPRNCEPRCDSLALT
jgi:hypothetical protein